MDHLLDIINYAVSSTECETVQIPVSVLSRACLYIGLALVASPFINYSVMKIWNHFLSWHWHRVNNNNNNNNYITAPCSCGSATVTVGLEDTDGSDHNGPSCWICLGHGPDDSGKPLRRDCSCRGSSSGYAHISCIVTMAEKKSKKWDGEIFHEYIKWWTECQICYQDFRNDLAVDLASEFVSFVDHIRQNFLRDQKQQAHIEALHVQHTALLDKTNETTHEHREEARVIANKLISIVRDMEHKYPKISDSVYAYEADAYSSLGNIALQNGTVESAKEALAYFEICKDVWVRLKNDLALTIIENSIALAKAECGEMNEINKEEAVESFLKEYKGYVEAFGPSHLGTLDSGIHLFLALSNAKREREAANFLKELAARSKQVHGKDHGMTRKIESYYLREKPPPKTMTRARAA